MTPVHQSGLLFVYICNKFEFAGIFISKLKIYTVFSPYCPFANCTFYRLELHKFL